MKQKLDLYDWASEYNETSKEWLKEFIENTFSGKVTHLGDCTKHVYACKLCILEDILRDYRDYYYFNEELQK